MNSKTYLHAMELHVFLARFMAMLSGEPIWLTIGR
jgi:hypothetical protein